MTGHDDDCECADCRADRAAEDRFWDDQFAVADEMPPHPDTFDLSDIDDQDEDTGPCSHLFNGERCELCDAEYNPEVHGYRVSTGALS